MTIKGGRSVSPRDVKGRDRQSSASLKRLLPRTLLQSSRAGRAAMAVGYFVTQQVSRVFATGSFTNANLLQLIPVGAFLANAGTRALFASGFVSHTMLAGGFLKIRIVAGGVAGNHTVLGINVGDELAGVLRQAGGTGLLTNLTTEFSVTAMDTINNAGGTNTTGDFLVVWFLDLT